MQNKHDLTEGPVYKKIISFVIPILLGSLFQTLYSTADAIIVGQFAGKLGLSAIDSVHTIIKLPINFLTGLASGITIIISQYFGAKKREEISDAAHTAIIFAISIGLLFSLLAKLAVPWLVGLLKVPAEILEDASAYAAIYYTGLAGMMLYNVAAAIMRGVGDSKTPFKHLLFANLLNIALDLIFVAYFKKGVKGAALATIISQLFSAVMLLRSLMLSDSDCKIYFKKLKYRDRYLREILKIGLPIGLKSLTWPISNTVIQSGINSFGVDYIAAWAVCGKLDVLIWAVTDSFYVAVSTFVAQNFGAEKWQRAREGVRKGMLLNLAAVAFISAILFFANRQISLLFVDDAAVLAIVKDIMQLLAPLYVVYVVADIFPAAIQGTGETVSPLIVTLFGMCLLRVAWIIFILPLNRTFMMLMYSYPVSWSVTAVLFAIYYYMRLSHFEQKALAEA